MRSMRAILTYHSIDDSGSPISVGRDEFRAHCTFLGSGRLEVLPLRDLLERPGTGDAVALTFDDGFANFWTDAAPELERHGLRATVFVVTGHVGAHNDWGGARSPGIPHLPLMDWDQLGALAARGFEVGAHPRTHPHLPALDTDRIEDELAGCTADLASRLGTVPASFAYPYGAVDARSVQAARGRFAAACTTDMRPLDERDDPALLPRLDMYYLRRTGMLEQWGSVAFRSRLWLRSQGRRVRRLLAAEPARGGLVA